MSEYKDITGQDLNVGDRVAYATSQSNSVSMKIGNITELVSKESGWSDRMVHKIRILVDTSSDRWLPEKPVLIEKLNRVVKL